MKAPLPLLCSRIGLLLVLALAQAANAQSPSAEVGLPYSQIYSAKDYRALPQNWAVVRDPRGLIYVGNSAGVLQFDGIGWELIPTGNLTAARSLAVDALGAVYVGAVGDFGVLRPDSLGRLRYHSLLDKLAPEDRDFADVWRCHATPEGIFFQTRTHLFRYQSLTGELRTWRADTDFDISFVVNGRCYVRASGRGLLHTYGDRLVLAPGSEAFALRRVFGLLPTPEAEGRAEGPHIVVTREGGLYRWREGQAPEALSTEVGPLLDRLRVYTAQVLPGWRLCYGTLRGGMIVSGLRGEVQQIIGKETGGLPDLSVYDIQPDGLGGVWLALNNGLVRLELPSALSLFDARAGLSGAVEAFARHNGRLIAATNQGLLELSRGRFAPVGSSSAQGRALLGTPGGLLYGTQDTLYAVEGTGRTLRLRGLAPHRTRVLLRDATDSLRVWVGRLDGLASLRWQPQQRRWIDEGELAGVEGEVSSMAQADGALWLSSPGQGVLRVSFEGPGRERPRVERLDGEQQLPPGAVIVYRSLSSVRFQTVDGPYRFDAAARRFLPDTTWRHLLRTDANAPLADVDYVTELPGGALWVSSGGQRWRGQRQPDGSYRLSPALPLRRITENIGAVEYFEADGTVWLGGFDGAVRYQPSAYSAAAVPFKTVIRQVRLGADSVLYGGADSLPSRPELRYGFGLLRIRYAGLSYDNAGANLYQTRLDGLDGADWSPWTPDVRTDYTFLPEGDYTFRVRARNLYGVVSSEASFRFRVSPPWVRTWWGLSLIAVGGLVVLGGFVRWRLSSLRSERDLLEQKVNERTQLISKQKQDLEAAYHEIEAKNQDITDSIQYASRIQQALLPHHSELSRIFTAFFVYYQPRDIVSGDFYWLSTRPDETIIAVCDCTGHGVPGALMSMMGNSLINQIVNERGVTRPSAILEELDQRVRALLRQNQQESAYDGMEVTLVRWQPSIRALTYAGAYLPVFISRGASLEEIAPSKRGIGGRLDATVPFTDVELVAPPGTQIYLTTDGIGDQFGGPLRRKFMNKQLRELLERHVGLPLADQGQRVAQAHRTWQGELDQLDDILVVGLRLD